MFILGLTVMLVAGSASPDTIITLGIAERDLTGDGQVEILRVVAVGQTIDSLEVTFSITSRTRVVFEQRLRPLTKTVGFDAGRRTLSDVEHQALLDDYGGWFFDDAKFLRPDAFVDKLRRQDRLAVERIGEELARDRRTNTVLDSLRSEGWTAAEALRSVNRWVPPYGSAYDTAWAASTWQDMRSGAVTVFEFSPGGDRVQAIAWDVTSQRFYNLWGCC